VIVAIAYLLQKTPYVFPIVGARKVEQMLANLEALEIDLTAEQVKELEGVVEFDPGFPFTMIVRTTICRSPSMGVVRILT
jgi:aryl-alcohol dehydrogenase-like predicted oxidoreductase